MKKIKILLSITFFTILGGCNENNIDITKPETEIRKFNNLDKTNSDWITLLKLNPSTNLIGVCEKTYTTGGFDEPAIWIHHAIDLSGYLNSKIKIRFYFSTGDALFNNHAGWFIDNIKFEKLVDKIYPNALKNKIWVTEGSNLTSGPRWHITDNKSNSPDYSWVYQNPETRNFQGSSVQSLCSDEQNWGALVLAEPVLLKKIGNLEFDTLWEIESVDPQHFDQMLIQIIVVE